jgi:hypothetical protein
MARIKLTMTPFEALFVVVEGNPGALSVCMDLLQHAQAIDPDAALGGLGTLLTFDEERIYGSRIWMFFKDVCGGDIGKMLAVLRADQLGQLAGVTREKISHAIDNRGVGLDVDAAVAAVKERLPDFDPARRMEACHG